MKRINKKIAAIFLLMVMTNLVFADRGFGKRSKGKYLLNISTTGTFRSSLGMNLRTGLSYKGSLLSSRKVEGNYMTSTNLMTYQKGNTTYIVPVKHRILMPEIAQGYTGMKLIIKSR